MKIYLFKVKDFTTILVGQRNEEQNYFYVQRGDGKIYEYYDYRITWSRLISEVDNIELI